MKLVNFSLVIGLICFLTILRSIGAVRTDEEQALLNLGNLHESRGEYSQAIRNYKQVLESEKYRDQAIVSLSALYTRLGRNEDSIQKLIEYLESSNPFHFKARIQLAKNYRNAQKYKEAIEQLKIAQKLKPKKPISYVEEVLTFLQSKNYQLAIQSAMNALAVFPDSYLLRNHLAKAYFLSGDSTTAMKHVSLSLKINPYFLETLEIAGEIFSENRKDYEALKAWSVALKISPECSSISEKLGNLYTKKNELVLAESVYQQILDLEPNRYDISTKIGILYLKAKNYKAAINQFSGVMADHPEYEPAQYFLAKTFVEQNKLDHAGKLLKALYAQYPNKKWIDVAYHQLFSDINEFRPDQTEKEGEATRSIARVTPPEYVVVRENESLSEISKELFHDFKKWEFLYRLNKDVISDPNKIYPGTRLKTKDDQGLSQ